MTTGSSGGDGPTGGENLGYRVGALEQSFAKMDGKLDIILDRLGATDARLASIEAKLDTKASAADLAAVEAKLERRIATIEAKIDSKASSADLAAVESRLEGCVAIVEAKLDSKSSSAEVATVVVKLDTRASQSTSRRSKVVWRRSRPPTR